jgi:hypothetical protein
MGNDDGIPADSRPKVLRTGLICPQCREPVAIVENRLPHTLVFWCPACDHRWSADEPGTPK